MFASPPGHLFSLTRCGSMPGRGSPTAPPPTCLKAIGRSWEDYRELRFRGMLECPKALNDPSTHLPAESLRLVLRTPPLSVSPHSSAALNQMRPRGPTVAVIKACVWSEKHLPKTMLPGPGNDEKSNRRSCRAQLASPCNLIDWCAPANPKTRRL